MKKRGERAIPKEEERDLIRRAKAGDKKAVARLIEAHTPFVMKVAQGFTLPVWVSMEDVRQEGIIGLLDAINKFDLEKYENKFLAYAYWRIHKAIVGYLTDMGYSMRIPFQDVMKLRAIVNRLDFNMSLDIEGDTDIVNQQKNLHILSLLVGCLPIHPTDVVGYHEHDDPYADSDHSLALKHDAMDDVLSVLIADEIEAKMGELTVVEGVMLSMYLGIHFRKEAMPLKSIAGEPAKVTEDGDIIIIEPGQAGFGLEVGETYNNVSRLIRQSEAKFRSILKEFFGNMYDQWRGDE